MLNQSSNLKFLLHICDTQNNDYLPHRVWIQVWIQSNITMAFGEKSPIVTP